MEFFYHHHWRWDWGFGNPNKTAVLIGLLMMACWIFAFWKKHGFWFALVLFTGLGMCLIHTYSRGGVVSVFAGMACLAAFAPRPWPWGRMAALLLSFVFLAGYSIWWDAGPRYVEGMSDQSITHRLEIWKQTPRMMVDAPAGWGFGRSGYAYMQWYQSDAELTGYRTLVNSHLTWLVEGGWLFRVFYIMAWGSIFLLLWPKSGRPWRALPFALWIMWAVAMFFSSVGESPWLWIIPVLALAASLADRFTNSHWPCRKAWLLPPLAAAFFCLLVIAVSDITPSDPPVRKKGDAILLGASEPAVWFLRPDASVLGEHYGHELRDYAKKIPCGVTASADDISHAGVLILSGKLPPALKSLQPRQILLLNPSNPTTELLNQILKSQAIKVCFGEFSHQERKTFWQQQAEAHPSLHIEEIPGAGDFLPQWLQCLK